MRVVKALLGLGLVAVLATMWLQRAAVVDAYANEGEASTDLHLDGLELQVDFTPVDPSPYEVATAPDTRDVPVALAFAEITTTTTLPPDDEDGDGDDEGGVAPPPAAPTTTIPPPPLYGGTAILTGQVTGPDGLIPFATVRVERHTNDGFVIKDVTTDERGRWTLPRLLGGRYRVRAWADGHLTRTDSDVFFLVEAETRQLDQSLLEVDLEPQLNLIDGGDIYVGLTGTIAVTVTVNSVDDDGFIVVSGLPGAIVTLLPSGGVSASSLVTVADHDGVARFTLRCDQVADPTALVQHQEDVRSFPLPACVPVPPPPPPPTTVPAPSDQGADESAPTPTTTGDTGA